MKRFVGLLCVITSLCLATAVPQQARAQDNQFPKTDIIIPNHSFEAGNFDERYEVSQGMDNSNTFVVDSGSETGAPDGRYFAKLTRGVGDAYVATQWIETGADVTGKAFTFTFDVKSHGAQALIGRLAIQRYPLDNDWSDTGAYTDLISATSNWQTNTAVLTFNRPRNGNTSSKLRIVLRPAHESESYIQPIYYDNLRLFEGPFNLSCGTKCTANAQCAQGLTCYQPMTYSDPDWEDYTNVFSEVGSGEITSHDMFITAAGVNVINIVKNGIWYSRYGNDQTWRTIDLQCDSSDTAVSCCELAGTCGLANASGPNDPLLAVNIFENNSSQVTVHITRLHSGVYSKTISPDILGEPFVEVMRSAEGWENQTSAAGLDSLSGGTYLSFTMAYDQQGNIVQNLTKFISSDVDVVNIFQRQYWLNRGWSQWTKVYDSTFKDIKYDYGDSLVGAYPLLIDPYFSNGQHHNYLIRADIFNDSNAFTITNSHLYTIDPGKIIYSDGLCKPATTPTFACDNLITSPSNLSVDFSCTALQANVRWIKASSGNIPNAYEIAMCETGTCTTDEEWNNNLIGLIPHSQSPEFVHAGYDYIKGQSYDFRIRSVFLEGETRTQIGTWSETLTQIMAGPTGDMDADCDVDFSDYSAYLDALRNPYAPTSLFERMIYFFNSLIANFGTTT